MPSMSCIYDIKTYSEIETLIVYKATKTGNLDLIARKNKILPS